MKAFSRFLRYSDWIPNNHEKTTEKTKKCALFNLFEIRLTYSFTSNCNTLLQHLLVISCRSLMFGTTVLLFHFALSCLNCADTSLVSAFTLSTQLNFNPPLSLFSSRLSILLLDMLYGFCRSSFISQTSRAGTKQNERERDIQQLKRWMNPSRNL